MFSPRHNDNDIHNHNPTKEGTSILLTIYSSILKILRSFAKRSLSFKSSLAWRLSWSYNHFIPTNTNTNQPTGIVLNMASNVTQVLNMKLAHIKMEDDPNFFFESEDTQRRQAQLELSISRS